MKPLLLLFPLLIGCAAGHGPDYPAPRLADPRDERVVTTTITVREDARQQAMFNCWVTQNRVKAWFARVNSKDLKASK